MVENPKSVRYIKPHVVYVSGDAVNLEAGSRQDRGDCP